ncbi:STAS domain-containing protein [Sporosarcina aquimarina]|uniref:STAS domain-containing protein n=1 Tax=Sporosarcina aquimarina TaxID=114975 RepID=A0ABU4G201_9BACL|nr:STAS domain-containing protein [Sporosarcina aquimarina]MDW0110997.1 STAS domain-containing protein [Sporosarcina aquimarina]
MNPTEEITQLKATIAKYEEIINETSAPIISSIVDNTILLPIVGYTDQERMERIRTKILEYAGDHRHIESAVLDFSSIRLAEEEGSKMLTCELQLMRSELQLMGIRPIMVGFTPLFVRELINGGIANEIESYANFKSALQVLMNEKGLSFTSN